MIKYISITGILLTTVALFGSGRIASAHLHATHLPIPQGVKQTVIPKLSRFNGDIFRNFAEFRVQNSSFTTAGWIRLEDEPYKMLVNCNTIIKVHRFEDGKETDYSCLMFIREHRHSTQKLKPVLVRETYEEVCRKMKRAIESR
tara:strand:- start:1315 stop:1746 length:432 start_codon:yes stop_codon:yes gene_type:complete